MDMHLDGYMLSRDLIISYLYDPILDEARKRKISLSQKILAENEAFNNKVNTDIMEQLERLCKNKLLTKIHVDTRSKSKRKQDRINGVEYKPKVVYLDAKGKNDAKIIEVSIAKGNKKTSKNIPEVLKKYLENIGYKVT